MSVFSKIGGWFVRRAKGLREAVIAFAKSDALRAILTSAEGAIVNAIVAELSLSNLSSEDKRKAAFERSVSAIKAAGLEAGTNAINLAIEAAVAKLKAAGSQE